METEALAKSLGHRQTTGAKTDKPNPMSPRHISTLPEKTGTALRCPMPEISRFLEIVISMYCRDHTPPHFHALYGEHEVTIDIATGLVSGEFPRRALAHVQEWRTLHNEDLAVASNLARASKPLPNIDPLE